MPRLWTFGDSNTAPYDINIGWSKEYFEWKKRPVKVYGELISKMLNYELINLGKGTSDNYTIFNEVCNAMEDINENDIILIGWSDYLRFRLVNDKDEWVSIIPNYKNLIFNNISEKTIQEILINRDSNNFKNEVENWVKIINKVFDKNKIIHWTLFNIDYKNVYKMNFERINQETNNILNDFHLSEKGQKDLSNKILQLLEYKVDKII